MTRIKREKKEGYKATRALIQGPSSYLYSKTITYQENKRTYKTLNDGPLAVFDTFEQAEKFGEDQRIPHVIWKCNYRESIHDRVWLEENGGFYTHINPLADNELILEGTHYADNVKLLERMKDNRKLY